jgi:hypothetical protein
MKGKRKVQLTTVVSLLLVYRLPTPLHADEEKPTSALLPAETAKPKSKRVKPEPAEAEVPSTSKSAGKFDGTRKNTWSEAMPWKRRGTHLIVIRNGKTAEHIEEWLGELPPGQRWLWLPEPYNKISPLYR